jgi:RNA polymerase sigma-70 factor (ECF subfamily)
VTTTPAAIDPYSSWDAAYVLGSLTAAERREYEQHVDGCDACRNRLAELSGLPGLLSLVGRGAVDPDASEPLPSAAPYAVFARKVRRRRAGLAAAAAAAVLMLGGGTAAVTARLLAPAPPPAAHATMTPGGATVQLAFTSSGQRVLTARGQASAEPWGTVLSWTCSYTAGPTPAGYASLEGPSGSNPSESRSYVLVLVTTAGDRVPLATWQASPGSTVSPVATTSIPLGSMRELLIEEQGTPGPEAPLLQAQL